jgi:hypothetical protein
MEKQSLTKKTGIKKAELDSYGFDEETTVTGAAETMRELLGSVQRDFESLIHPDSGINNMIEHNLLTDEQKKQLPKILMEVGKLIRSYQGAKILGEKDLVIWIKEFHKYWGVKKIEIGKICKDLAEMWSSDKVEKINLEYFG